MWFTYKNQISFIEKSLGSAFTLIDTLVHELYVIIYMGVHWTHPDYNNELESTNQNPFMKPCYDITVKFFSQYSKQISQDCHNLGYVKKYTIIK